MSSSNLNLSNDDDPISTALKELFDTNEYKKQYVIGTSGALTEELWKDDMIQRVQRYEILHLDQDANDYLFLIWLNEIGSTPKQVSSFVALTAYIATQLRHVNSGSFMFSGKECTRDEYDRLPGLEQQKYVLSQYDPHQNGSTTQMVSGGDKVARQVYVPAYAMYTLRVIYRSNFALCDKLKMDKLREQIALFYGTEVVKSVPIEFSMNLSILLKNCALICSKIVNTVLVNALLAALEPSTDCDDRDKSVLSYCLLLHSKWNGLGSVSRLLFLCSNEKKKPQFFLGLARVDATEEDIDALTSFLDRHMSEDSLSRYAPWCRAMSSHYEMRLGNKTMILVMAIWSVVIDPSMNSGLWSSPQLDNMTITMKMTAKTIGVFIFGALGKSRVMASKTSSIAGAAIAKLDLTPTAVDNKLKEISAQKASGSATAQLASGLIKLSGAGKGTPTPVSK